MKTISAVLLLVSVLLAGCSEQAAKQPTAAETDPALAELLRAGRARAASCAACHGAQGISVNPMYPSLAGQDESSLRSALLAYRDGERVNNLMSPQARALSDQDISLLAAYFAALPAR